MAREQDALALLTHDHTVIKKLFRDYEDLLGLPGDPERKAQIVGEICFQLSIHMQIEEEVFYPAVRTSLGWTALIDHALSDHLGGKELIAKLDEMEPVDADFDASVAVLGAYILPHMDDEQAVIFQEVRRAGLNTAALGQRMAQRQRVLRDHSGSSSFDQRVGA